MWVPNLETILIAAIVVTLALSVVGAYYLHTHPDTPDHDQEK